MQDSSSESSVVIMFLSCEFEPLTSPQTLYRNLVSFWSHYLYVKHDADYDRPHWFLRLSLHEITSVILLAIILAMLRKVLCGKIFSRAGDHFNLTGAETKRFSDKSWNLLTYSFIFGLETYVLIYDRKCSLLMRPSEAFDDYSLDMQLSPLVTLVYIVQLALNLNAFYGLLFINEKDKDFGLLLFHHTVCLVLLLSSFKTGCHNVGLLCFFAHDSCDVFLCAGKACLALKTDKNGNTNATFATLATLLAVSLTITWFALRVIWFPLQALNAASLAPKDSPDFPAFAYQIALLMVVYCMNIYWSYYLLKVVGRKLAGGEWLDSRRESKDKSLLIIDTKAVKNGFRKLPKRL